MATAECCSRGGLNSSSGGELKLYLGCTGSTSRTQRTIPKLKMTDMPILPMLLIHENMNVSVKWNRFHPECPVSGLGKSGIVIQMIIVKPVQNHCVSNHVGNHVRQLLKRFKCFDKSLKL